MANDLLLMPSEDNTPLRDLVFTSLRSAILTGKLEPGTRLLEMHLADEMGVSRTPVREALRMLELDGLVIVYPRRGAVVAQITKKDMLDVLEVRVAIEELAVGLACERASKEQLAEIRAQMEEFDAASVKNDISNLAYVDGLFHTAIVRASNNDKLLQVASQLSERINRYRFETLKDKNRYPQLREEHLHIYKAIEERHADLAKTQAREHIMWQVEYFVKRLGD